ncbi:hypothetical protein I316_04677 [Kwoniella heveanensis BCC8398]|uniref:Uncharacterized protein n=1 Tax=Kwoniella heveanensis BCC8398 TaxID=1296120 RepID=A0A1B9GRA8_9TREE|nr:hypothetical protein I316_04677 [Kwoniella heveanensis BCC8398]
MENIKLTAEIPFEHHLNRVGGDCAAQEDDISIDVESDPLDSGDEAVELDAPQPLNGQIQFQPEGLCLRPSIRQKFDFNWLLAQSLTKIAEQYVRDMSDSPPNRMLYRPRPYATLFPSEIHLPPSPSLFGFSSKEPQSEQFSAGDVVVLSIPDDDNNDDHDVGELGGAIMVDKRSLSDKPSRGRSVMSKPDNDQTAVAEKYQVG